MPSLEFTLMVGCPLKCTFCPQDTLRENYGKAAAKYFQFDDFKRIVDKLPPHVRIDFSGMAEPWANPHATSMVEYALNERRTIAVYTTLYGMSTQDRERVIAAFTARPSQIEVVCLHLPDANANMRGWRYSEEYEANLRAFLEFAVSRRLARFEVMTMDGSGRVHPDLAHLGIQLGMWSGHTRAGNVLVEAVSGQSIAGTPQHHGAVSCSFTPFYDQNVVLPNGDVVLCCMDYSLKHRIGNLLDQDYYDVFAQGLGALIAENMQPRHSNASLCKSCDRALVHRTGPIKQFWHAG